MRRSALLLVTLLAGLALSPAAARAQATTEIVLDGLPRKVPLVERQGRSFVALESVAALLGGRIEEEGAETVVLVIDDARIVVRRRIPFVESGGRWYQLTEPAQKDASGFFLPASSLHLLFPHLWPGRFQTAPPSGGAAPPAQGAVARAGASEEGVDFRVDPERTRLAFHAPRTPGVEVDDSTPRTLRLTLSGVELPAAVGRGLEGVGLVDSARARVEDGRTELTLWLDAAARVYAVAPLRRPAGLEVVLLEAPADAAAALLATEVPLAGARGDQRTRGSGIVEAPREASVPLPRAEPRRVEPGGGESVPAPAMARAPARPRLGGQWIVVVDAGHGGHDPGALGPEGSREKDVTLAVALALREALARREGIRVILTRDDDTFVPLGRRARIANEARADVFFSIHANSAARSSAEGFETYFLSAAVTEEARRVAQRENAALRYESPEIDPSSFNDVNFILWDLAQNEYLRESSVLAETVQEELDRRIPLKSRGVKQAPLWVLKGAFMPSVLFETAFISNPDEEELLNDAAFRSRLAESLAASLVAYLDRYGRKVGAETAAR